MTNISIVPVLVSGALIIGIFCALAIIALTSVDIIGWG